MNEVAERQSNAPSTQVNQADQVLRSDILVPYVVLAQASSESVKERKAQMGDIIRSTNFEKLGDPDKGIEVIFLHNPKTNWIVEQKEGNRYAFRRIEPRTAANETAEWNFWGDKDGNELPPGTPGGSEWRRVKQLMAFAILPQDIAAYEEEMKKVEQGELPDPSKALTPVIVSFRASSYKAGKEVATFFTQAKSMRVPIHRYKLKLSCTLEKNDDGSFYVWNVDRAKPIAVPKEQLEVVQEWAQIINAGNANLQVHDEGASENYGNMSQDTPKASESARAEVC